MRVYYRYDDNAKFSVQTVSFLYLNVRAVAGLLALVAAPVIGAAVVLRRKKLHKHTKKRIAQITKKSE